MVVATEKNLYNIAQYLEMEDTSEVRHEFHNGKTIEMAGGILHHNAIKLRLGGKIDQLLDSRNIPNMILNSDTKVRIESANRFVYPDLTISNGTPIYYTTPEGKTRRDIIINPLVIFEVLSEDTRLYDKGEKFDLYCTIPDFQEYILLEPEFVWAKCQFLQDPENNLWKHEIITDKSAKLPIRSLGIELPLEELYAVLEKLPVS